MFHQPIATTLDTVSWACCSVPAQERIIFHADPGFVTVGKSDRELESPRKGGRKRFALRRGIVSTRSSQACSCSLSPRLPTDHSPSHPPSPLLPLRDIAVVWVGGRTSGWTDRGKREFPPWDSCNWYVVYIPFICKTVILIGNSLSSACL